METPDYAAVLTSLRSAYVEANPKQRLSIAKQRIRYPGHRPNLLVSHVAAVEGFARCLAMHVRGSTQEELSAVYPEYRNKGPEELINEYLSNAQLGDPTAYFGSETWLMFGFAIKFRNLLVHECTYLADDLSAPLIDACRSVLGTLASSKGLEG